MIVPAPGYLLIKLDKPPEKTESGIHLGPQKVDHSKPSKGEVVDGSKEHIGHTVYYHPYVAFEIESKDKDIFHIIKKSDIVAYEMEVEGSGQQE